ncbi:MAG: bacteriohemerythrin [Archaeoglobaceae archaeon]
MKWDDSFSIGIAEIDAQHKKLVEMLANLLEEMKRGQGKTVIAKTIDEMLSYAKEHFATEDKYMKLYSYPYAVSHRKEHDKFAEIARSFYSNYLNGNLTAIDLMNFLKNWLVEHILGSDKKLGKYVCEVTSCRR